MLFGIYIVLIECTVRYGTILILPQLNFTSVAALFLDFFVFLDWKWFKVSSAAVGLPVEGSKSHDPALLIDISC